MCKDTLALFVKLNNVCQPLLKVYTVHSHIFFYIARSFLIFFTPCLQLTVEIQNLPLELIIVQLRLDVYHRVIHIEIGIPIE